MFFNSKKRRVLGQRINAGDGVSKVIDRSRLSVRQTDIRIEHVGDLELSAFASASACAPVSANQQPFESPADNISMAAVTVTSVIRT